MKLKDILMISIGLAGLYISYQIWKRNCVLQKKQILIKENRNKKLLNKVSIR